MSYVEQGPTARRHSGQEIGETSVERRHLGRGYKRPLLGIEQGDPGNAEPANVCLDGGRRRRIAEAAAVGRDDEEVAQIADLYRLVGDLRAVTAAGRQLGQIELDGGVLGEPGHLGELPLDPIGNGDGAAVGDQAEARLPCSEITRLLGADEAVGEDRAEQQQGNERDAGDRDGAAGDLRAKVSREL